MEFDECIHKRRSIRSFSDKKVEKELLLKIVEAGRWAPSGANIQPWYFYIIEDDSIIESLRSRIYFKTIKRIEKIEKEKRDRILQNTKRFGMLFNAPNLISVCVDLSKSRYYLPKTEPQIDEVDKLLDNIEVISVGAAIQNMLLKITDLGLGACWCRVNCFLRRDMEKIIGIKYPYFLIANIALGYPDEHNAKKSGRKDIKSICKFI